MPRDGASTRRVGGGERLTSSRSAAVDGDVRARLRHLADERVDLRRRRGPRHDGERGPVGDRPRSLGVGGVHPDQQQGRRSDRAQAGVRARPSRLRHRRRGDDLRPEPRRHHHLLGADRRTRGVASAAGDAVADPRQLRRYRTEEGLCPRRRGGGDRRRRRSAARRVHHDVPVVARRLPPRSRRHRRRALRHQARRRPAVHGAPRHRPRRRDVLGDRDGRHRARHPRLAGGRRVRSARCW